MPYTEFLVFTSKIQRLINEAIESRGAPDDFWEEEIREIEKLLQGRAFLPNLREVVFERCPRDKTAAIVLGGSLRIETLEVGSQYDFVPAGLYPVEGWIQRLHRAKLRRLKLYAQIPSVVIDLTRFGHLRHLELCNESSVASYEWWLMFSQCQNLRTLDLRLNTIDQPPTSRPSVSFPMLESFDINTTRSDTLWFLLNSTMPSLLTLKLADGVESSDLHTLVAHLQQHSPKLEDLDSCIHADITSFFWDTVPALLANLKLRKLSLSGLINTNAIPAHQEDLPLEHWTPLLVNLDSFRLSILLRHQTQAPHYGTPTTSLVRTVPKASVATVKCRNGWGRLRERVDKYRMKGFSVADVIICGEERKQTWELAPFDMYPTHDSSPMSSDRMSSAEFLVFTSKIRNLTVEVNRGFSEDEIREIKQLLQGRALLPNLHVVSFSCHPNEETATMLLEGSSRIESFRVEHHHVDRTATPCSAARWVQILQDSATLHRMKLNICIPSNIPINIARFRRLRQFELHSGHTTIEYEWWLTLSTWQHLQMLSLTVGPVIHPFTSHRKVLFPALESFTIRTTQSDALWLLLNSVMPSLLSLGLGDKLESSEFRTLVAHLAQHSPNLEVLSYCIQADTAFFFGDTIPVSLSVLKLRKLELAGLFHTDAIPEHREALPLEHWRPLLANLDSFH
ncbi:hypothetical protein FRB99_007123, partial [Tulasnella sp. 403]